MGIGAQGFIGLGREVGWGSKVAITDYVEALSENIGMSINFFTVKNIIGTITEADQVAGMRDTKGALTIPGHPDQMAAFLKGAFQTCSTTVILSGYLHQLEFFSTTKASEFSSLCPLQSYTLEINRNVSDTASASQLIAGAAISKITFSMNQGQALQVAMDIIGRTTANGSASTAAPTYPNSPLFPFTWNQVSLSVAGAANVAIESFNVTIDSKLQGFGAFDNTNYYAKLRRTQSQTVDITGVMDFADLTEYNKFVMQSEQAISINMFAASSFQLLLELPRVVYTAFPLGMPNAGRLTVNFTGKGRYHQGSGTAYRVMLTTTKSLN